MRVLVDERSEGDAHRSQVEHRNEEAGDDRTPPRATVLVRPISSGTQPHRRPDAPRRDLLSVREDGDPPGHLAPRRRRHGVNPPGCGRSSGETRLPTSTGGPTCSGRRDPCGRSLATRRRRPRYREGFGPAEPPGVPPERPTKVRLPRAVPAQTAAPRPPSSRTLR